MANTASRADSSQSSSQPQNMREWCAVGPALAGMPGVESVIELPGEAKPFAECLAREGYRVVTADPAANDQPLPLAAKSVDAILSSRFPFHLDRDHRRRLLREFGRVARRGIILLCPPRLSKKRLRSDFEDAGLEVVKITTAGSWMSGRRLVLAEPGFIDPESLAQRLRGTPYADLEITARLGEGKRSVVYRARWRGRDVGVKVYKPAAIARHAGKHQLALAEFEHRRNLAFFQASGLAKYVAEPLGLLVEPRFQLTLQEFVDGELYYFAHRDRASFISPRFMDDLAELVRLSHAAQLYDIDLHAMNVMVDRQTGGPKLFDFNQIPFHERPQNPLVALALKVGLLGKGSRDLRKLARLRDFARIERRLLKFYEDGSD